MATKSARMVAGLSQAIEEYLVWCRGSGAKGRGVKPSTIRNQYGFPLRSVFKPWCEAQGIDYPEEIDQRTLDRFAAHLRDHGGPRGALTHNSVWTYLKSVNAFLKWASSVEVHATIGKPRKRKIRPLERSEIDHLERTAGSPRDKIIIRLLADTGIRPGELISLRGRDVCRSSRRCWIHVMGKQTARENDERDVRITPELYGRLKSLVRGPDLPVFYGLRRDYRTGELEPLKLNGLQKLMRGLGLNADLDEPLNPIVFRHSACRWMLKDLRMSTIEVELILGHSSDRMIREHYANLTQDDAGDRLMALMRAMEE